MKTLLMATAILGSVALWFLAEAVECYRCQDGGVVQCSYCQGTGSAGQCYTCKGSGVELKVCYVCGGDGWIGSQKCVICKGLGLSMNRCSMCSGSGSSGKCYSCRGLGRVACSCRR